MPNKLAGKNKPAGPEESGPPLCYDNQDTKYIMHDSG